MFLNVILYFKTSFNISVLIPSSFYSRWIILKFVSAISSWFLFTQFLAVWLFWIPVFCVSQLRLRRIYGVISKISDFFHTISSLFYKHKSIGNFPSICYINVITWVSIFLFGRIWCFFFFSQCGLSLNVYFFLAVWHFGPSLILPLQYNAAVHFTAEETKNQSK